MLKVLIARSIFCPNYDYLQTCCSNLVNLFLKMKFQKQDINDERLLTLYLCGWIKKEFIVEIKNTVDMILNDNIFVNIIYDLWSLNYGKYKILNNIIQICHDYDKVFYSDHDIIFKLHINNLFTLLENILDYRVGSYTVGIVMLNQLEDVRHQCDIYENEIDEKGIKYIYPTIGNFTSIASGCFYIDSKNFIELGNFDLKAVYGLDDYYIVKKLYDKLIIAVVTKDIYVRHPFNNCKKFSKWKEISTKTMMRYIIEGGVNDNYYSDIEQSMNIWS